MEAGGCIVDTAAVLMINLYGRRGLFQKAKSLFNSLQKKDHPPSLYVYNTMIKLCAVCKELEEAIFVFDRMEENGRMFDAVTVSILVHAYTKEGMEIKLLFIGLYLVVASDEEMRALTLNSCILITTCYGYERGQCSDLLNCICSLSDARHMYFLYSVRIEGLLMYVLI